MVRCPLSTAYSQVRSNGVTHRSEEQSAWCPGQGDYVTVWHIGIQLLPSAHWCSCHKEQLPGRAVGPLASPGLMGFSQSPLCLWSKELGKRMLAPLFPFETQFSIPIAARWPVSVSVAGAYCYLIKSLANPYNGHDFMTHFYAEYISSQSFIIMFLRSYIQLKEECFQLGYGNLHH